MISAANDNAEPVKTCTKCGETKPISEFYKSKGGKFGVKADCKVCRKASVAQWADDNPEKRDAQCALYRERHREELREIQAIWRHDNPEAEKAKGLKWRTANPEVSRRNKIKWAEENPEKVQAAILKHYVKRRRDPKRRLEDSIRSGVYAGIVNGSKDGRRTFELLGYSRDELRAHLESKFQRGMTWDNYGPVWHVDHVLPLASFSYETPDDPEFKASWALTNLQPLWALENILKRDRLDHPSQAALLAAAANDNQPSSAVAAA